jgi:hypothetical protein
MTLKVRLTKDLERDVREEAERQGLPVEEWTLRLIKENLPSSSRAAAVEDLIESWIQEGDTEEQRETGEYLIRALDEDRLSDRKLFPPELKGVTW